MPSSLFSRTTTLPLMKDIHDHHSPLVFDESPVFPHDSDQMIFGPLDIEDIPSLHSSAVPHHWDPFDIDQDVKSAYSFSALSPLSQFDYTSQTSPASSYYDSSAGFCSPDDLKRPLAPDDAANMYLAGWLTDPDLALPPGSSSNSSSPIPIPAQSPSPTAFVPYNGNSHFPTDGTFSSPTAFAAHHPLPRSISPSPVSPLSANSQMHAMSISPRDASLHTPTWAAQLWDTTGAQRTSPRGAARHSPLVCDATIRQPLRRSSMSTGSVLLSASAPTHGGGDFRPPGMSRGYSRRAESVSVSDERDATVRRKKRQSADEPSGGGTGTGLVGIGAGNGPEKTSSESPLKSVLKPPKLAPSAWQLYFTDWIQKQQAAGTRKLNVAQAAKEAGQEYAALSTAEKEPYKQRSQAAKELRERELQAYMRTLTPEDIKRENAFRAAQRRAGKSRRSNIKDPNAPKKPLSAYFMFLQRIRAHPQLVHEIFGDETETTKQSVLAAAKWRSMTDAERQPFLAQAEQEKMEYEAARRIYEEGHAGYGTSINFSILPGSPASAFPGIKLESESESEGFTTDDSPERLVRL